MKTIKLLFAVAILQFNFSHAQFKILSDNSPYMKGHIYMRAYEGDGASGTAYVQARDMSGSSSIGMQFRTQNSGSIISALKINPDGNAGFGTTSPECILHIKSSMPQIRFEESDQSNKKWHIEGYNSGLSFVETNYAERMRINAGGNLSINGHVGINGYISSNYWLYVTGDCRADSWSTYSDSAAKKDIKDIDVSEKIKELRPVQFKWKEDKYPCRKADSLNRKIIDNRINYGFIAQEVRQIFPDIVTKEENGELSMNYDALIPMLVDVYKKMDKKVETMEKIITGQEQEIIKLKEKNNDGKVKSAAGLENITNNNTLLSQNTPNPFKENTVINYYLSNETTNAVIYIFNLSGSLLKTYPLTEQGAGNITIQGSELKPGMYIYTLVADGNEIDTKRMILTE